MESGHKRDILVWAIICGTVAVITIVTGLGTAAILSHKDVRVQEIQTLRK